MSDAPGTFAYPGSKTTLASWIIEHFPEHKQYIEAFGGAASVLVSKERSELEVYNDLNGDCVKFFEAVRDSPRELERWVEYTPYSRKLFEEYVEAYPEWPDDLVERAGRFLCTQHSAFAAKGVTTESSTYSVQKAGSSGSDRAQQWDTKPSQLRRLNGRFKGVNIEQMDYEDLVEKYDHEDAFFYFDPPYVDVGDDYYQVEGGGFDHDRFVGTVLDMDAKWLISYDHNIPERLSDFHTVRRTKKATMSSSQPEKVETLTMNYDPTEVPMFRESQQEGLESFTE